jgi:hypothetical protein
MLTPIEVHERRVDTRTSTPLGAPAAMALANSMAVALGGVSSSNCRDEGVRIMLLNSQSTTTDNTDEHRSNG